jgi:hypothetical protein
VGISRDDLGGKRRWRLEFGPRRGWVISIAVDGWTGLALPGKASVVGVEDEDDEVDDEEEDDGDFEGEHPAVVAVLGEELVEIVEGTEFGVDSAMPVREMEAGGDVFVEAGKMPIAKEFGDVG